MKHDHLNWACENALEFITASTAANGGELDEDSVLGTLRNLADLAFDSHFLNPADSPEFVELQFTLAEAEKIEREAQALIQ
jgi:hypothetical protein